MNDIERGILTRRRLLFKEKYESKSQAINYLNNFLGLSAIYFIANALFGILMSNSIASDGFAYTSNAYPFFDLSYLEESDVDEYVFADLLFIYSSIKITLILILSAAYLFNNKKISAYLFSAICIIESFVHFLQTPILPVSAAFSIAFLFVAIHIVRATNALRCFEKDELIIAPGSALKTDLAEASNMPNRSKLKFEFNTIQRTLLLLFGGIILAVTFNYLYNYGSDEMLKWLIPMLAGLALIVISIHRRQ